MTAKTGTGRKYLKRDRFLSGRIPVGDEMHGTSE